MTNSPQIPTIPQDVVEAIEVLISAVMKATRPHLYGDSNTPTEHMAEQALITAIAAHLRPVVPVDDTEVERLRECLQKDASKLHEIESWAHKVYFMPGGELDSIIERLLVAYNPECIKCIANTCF